MAPRGGVAIARIGGARPLGLAAVIGLLWGLVLIRRLRLRPRLAMLTKLKNRPPDPRGPCPGIWTPVRR